MGRRTFSREVLIFLAFFALTALMTWPWILHLRDAVSDRGDPYSITYWLWWDYHQTFHHPLNLFNATAFFPYKYTMAFTENDYGVSLLFFPLFALGLHPLTILSLATLVAFAFSGYGMFRLTRTLTNSNGAAWIAGIVFAFLPYHFQRLPHLHLIFAGWIPLLIEALVLFTRQRSWKRATWLGVTFTMNALTCVTWFMLSLVPLALSAVFLMAWWRLWRDRDFWIRGPLIFVGVSIVLLWFMIPYYRVHEMYGFARSAEQVVGLSARPIHWLAISERNKLWTGLGGKAAIDELTLFPGFLPPLLVLAAFLLVRPASSDQRFLRFQQIRIRRPLLILLDVLAFTLLLIALLTIGYGGIHFRLFGFELFSCAHPIRPLIFFLITLSIRMVLAYPEVLRRLLDLKNFRVAFRSNPTSIAFILGITWAVIGFLGSFGMRFFFHRILFELVPFFKSMRAPVRWAMICYVGLSILAGLGAVRITNFLVRWQLTGRRSLVYVALAMLILFEQRVAPIEFAHGEVDPDAITLRLKKTPMSGGIVELPAERDNYAYFRYMLRAADHGRPIVTASSSFAPPIVQEIESLTLARPIPDGFFDLLESIPTSYLVVHNSLLSPESRSAIEALVARGVAGGRIRFINSYGNLIASDDLYAITKTEPKAQTEASNRIDDSRFFVRQQYLDLFNREPDSTEWNNLVAFIDGCKGEPGCLQAHRIQSAAGLLQSTEFRETSYFVYRLYNTSFGRMPKYVEWAHDIKQLSTNGPVAKESFAKEWVTRAEFLDRYPEALTNFEYLDKLLRTSGQTASQAERQTIIDSLNNGKTTRADLLMKLTTESSVPNDRNNEALVEVCYLNYLKRDPDPEGYRYWLQLLKSETNGESALLRGFIYSSEYRVRFGQP